MIKAKGDKKVERWTHQRAGLETDIYLRRTSFVATLMMREFMAPDIARLRKMLADYAEHWITLEWFGLIHITIGEAHTYRDEIDKEDIEFGHERLWLSISPAGEIFKCDWDIPEKHRKAKMQSLGGGYAERRSYGDDIKLTGLPLGAPLKRRGNEWYLDFDEGLWLKFEQIAEGIRALRKRLKELVSSERGLQTLLDGGGSQLFLKE